MAQQDDQRAVKAARATVHMLEGTLHRISELEDCARNDKILIMQLRDLVGPRALIGTGSMAQFAPVVIDRRVEEINRLLAPLEEKPLG